MLFRLVSCAFWDTVLQTQLIFCPTLQTLLLGYLCQISVCKSHRRGQLNGKDYLPYDPRFLFFFSFLSPRVFHSAFWETASCLSLPSGRFILSLGLRHFSSVCSLLDRLRSKWPSSHMSTLPSNLFSHLVICEFCCLLLAPILVGHGVL